MARITWRCTQYVPGWGPPLISPGKLAQFQNTVGYIWYIHSATARVDATWHQKRRRSSMRRTSRSTLLSSLRSLVELPDSPTTRRGGPRRERRGEGVVLPLVRCNRGAAEARARAMARIKRVWFRGGVATAAADAADIFGGVVGVFEGEP